MEQGVTPKATITLPEGSNLADQVALLLDQSGLALAVSENQIVLTSARKVAAHGERLDVEGTGVLWRVTDASWADEIGRAISEASPLMVKLSIHQETAWTATRRPGYEPRDIAGWTVHEIDLADSTAAILVVDRNLLVSGLWFSFLVVAFLTWMVTLRYPALALVPIVGFLLGAAYLPDFWAPWLSAGFWGSCAGLFIRLVTVRRAKVPGRVVATRKVSEATAVAVIGSLLTLTAATGTAAQPVETKELARCSSSDSCAGWEGWQAD